MENRIKQKVVVTGASGFLGSRLSSYLRESGTDVIPYPHSSLDITDLQACRRALDSALQCTAVTVVNCSALADTGYCQTHEDESMAVNVEGAANLALACREYGAQYIYISSDQVYNGTGLDGLLKEDAPLSPVNVYGQHKLLCEKRVAEIMPAAVGLRLSWMYDRPDTVFPKNTGILLNLLKASGSGVPIRANVREYRGMTDVWDVVKGIAALLEGAEEAREAGTEQGWKRPSGVYNFGSPNTLDTYSTLLLLAEREGFDNPSGLIVPDSSRPGRNLSMDISRLRETGIDFPPTVAVGNSTKKAVEARRAADAD